VSAQHFDGKPCKRCGGTLRYVAKRGCVTCARAYDKVRAQRMSPEERQRRREYNAAYRVGREAEATARTRAWYAANPERSAEYHRAYRVENRARILANIHNRRAIKRAAPGRHTAADVRAIGRRQKWRCAWCGVGCKSAYHVDHVIPLARGGSNWPANLCIACPPCNLRKKAAHPDTFARTMGALL
jgi:5-methylcytosine-specific restriction endonuclease McrA